MSLIFWPEFPYLRWASPEESAQTVEEATKAIQVANLRKVNKMARNVQNQQRGGFAWSEPKHPMNQTISGQIMEEKAESPMYPASYDVNSNTGDKDEVQTASSNEPIAAEHRSEGSNDNV